MEYRKAKGVKEQYNSLEALRVAWGMQPVSKRTKDMNKLKAQREAFCGKHRCKSCGQPMEYIFGTSIMSCKNPSCKGVKQVRTDKDGNEIVTYLPSYDLLDSVGASIASNIFD